MNDIHKQKLTYLYKKLFVCGLMHNNHELLTVLQVPDLILFLQYTPNTSASMLLHV